jgi:hypothetical protein
MRKIIGEMYILWFTCPFATERELGACWTRQHEQTDKPPIYVMLTGVTAQEFNTNHPLESGLIKNGGCR